MVAMILGGFGVAAGVGVHLWGALSFRFDVMVAGIALGLVSAGVALAGLGGALHG